MFQFFKIKAEELQKTEKNPANWGLLPIIIGFLIYYAGIKADINLFGAVSLFILLCGITIFLYGQRIFNIVLSIILLFSISIPVFPIIRFTVSLQIFLADIASKILHFLNINTQVMGSNIFIDKYLVTIHSGCIGIRSISSLLVVSFLLFYFKNISILKKTLLLLFVCTISFAGNILRILLTNFYIIYNGLKGAVTFHYCIGLVIFVISLFVILMINEFIGDSIVEN
jgi:exosortase